MKSKNQVKMLAAFALVLLVVCATEGRIMNKCELKAQLDAAQLQQITVMEETITVKSLIARLVCKASISAFNTSFVKNITAHNQEIKPAQAPPQVASQVLPQTPSSGAPPQASPRRGPPQAPSSRLPPQAPAGAPPKFPSSGSPPKVPPTGAPAKVPPTGAPAKVPLTGAPAKVPPTGAPAKVPLTGAPPKVPPTGAPAKVPPTGAPAKVPPTGAPAKVPLTGAPAKVLPSGAPPKPYAQASTKGPQGSGDKTQHPHLTPAAKVVGHLYGMFQLSDQLSCDSGMIPSLNVCNIACSALTDDDITDDIACLKMLANFVKVNPEKIPSDVKKIKEMLSVKECRSVIPANYFADCV